MQLIRTGGTATPWARPKKEIFLNYFTQHREFMFAHNVVRSTANIRFTYLVSGWQSGRVFSLHFLCAEKPQSEQRTPWRKKNEKKFYCKFNTTLLLGEIDDKINCFICPFTTIDHAKISGETNKKNKKKTKVDLFFFIF